MKVIFKINIQLILLLLVLSSCEIQKRKYRSGYFINRISDNQTGSSSAKSPETDKLEIEVTNKENNRKVSPNRKKIERADIAVKVNRPINEQKTIVKSFADVRKKNVFRKFETPKSSTLKEDEKKEPYKPKARTGISWLDWTIQVLIWIGLAFALLTLVILLIGIYASLFTELWAAIVIAFTTNLWVTLLYILAFIAVIILIGIGMDKLFKFLFPNK